jgi:hypothetical protein
VDRRRSAEPETDYRCTRTRQSKYTSPRRLKLKDCQGSGIMLVCNHSHLKLRSYTDMNLQAAFRKRTPAPCCQHILIFCPRDVAGNAVRTFPYQVIFKNNNTATNCLSLCGQFRYNAAGMEYGEECWCGDIANVVPNGAVLKPESDCNTPCTGNCESPRDISLYLLINY